MLGNSCNACIIRPLLHAWIRLPLHTSIVWGQLSFTGSLRDLASTLILQLQRKQKRIKSHQKHGGHAQDMRAGDSIC